MTPDLIHGDAPEIVLGQEALIAPGVRGYMIDEGEALWVPLVVSEHPGTGDVSRFLDALPRDRTVKFPTIISPRLEGMLARRGFLRSVEDVEIAGWGIESIEVWTRIAASALPLSQEAE